MLSESCLTSKAKKRRRVRPFSALALSFCFYLWSQPAYGEDFPFEKASPLYVGSRALGMGNAFVSVSDDASAGFWNPAGLIQFQGVRVFGMSKVHDRQSYAFDPKGIAYSYRGCSLFWGNKIALRTPSGTPDFNYYSAAKQINPYVALGTSLKFKRKHPYPTYQFFGSESGYDIGALVKPAPNWKLGFVGGDRNLNFMIDSLTIGSAYQNRGLLIPIDFHINLGQKAERFSIYAGLEKQLGSLYVRAGISDGWVAAGVGIKLRHKLSIDYALIGETSGSSHFLSAEVEL